MATPAPSAQELYDLGLAEARGRRPELTVLEGDISDMLLVGAAAMADHVTGYAARLFRTTFVGGARNDDITTLGLDHWQLPRGAPVRATGVCTITRSINGPAGTIDAGTVIATEKDSQGSEVRVLTVDDVVWALNEHASKDVNCVAELTGPGGNVAGSTLTRIVSTLFDSAFTVHNTDGFAGGADEEDEDAYKARLRALPQSLRRGTLDALEYGALQVPAVRKATAIRELDPAGGTDADGEPKTTGIVTVYISDASGGSSAQMIADTKTELRKWKAAGEVVNVVGAVLRPTTVGLSLTIRTGVVIDAAKVKAAIVALAGRLGVGETLYKSAIQAAVRSIDPDGIREISVSDPLGDVDPDDDELVVVTAGDITIA